MKKEQSIQKVILAVDQDTGQQIRVIEQDGKLVPLECHEIAGPGQSLVSGPLIQKGTDTLNVMAGTARITSEHGGKGRFLYEEDISPERIRRKGVLETAPDGQIERYRQEAASLKTMAIVFGLALGLVAVAAVVGFIMANLK